MDNPVDGDGGHRSPGYRPTLLDSQSLVSSLFRQASERLRERGGAAQTHSRQDGAVDQWTEMRRGRLTLLERIAALFKTSSYAAALAASPVDSRAMYREYQPQPASWIKSV